MDLLNSFKSEIENIKFQDIIESEIFLKCSFWVIFWTVMYIIVLIIGSQIKLKISKLDELDVLNRIVSIMHGTLALILSGYHFMSYGAHCSLPNIDFEVNLFLMSSGYFIYDFLAMAYYGLLDIPMTIHHGVVVLGEIMTIYRGTSASLSLAAMFIAEISNPAMHIRVILKHVGLRYTKIYELFELIFIFLYVFVRLLLGFYIVWEMIQCSSLDLTVRVSAVVILIQTIFFALKMKSIVQKRYNEISCRYSKGINMRWFYPPLTDNELKVLGIESRNEKHFL